MIAPVNDSSAHEGSIDRWTLAAAGFGALWPVATVIALFSELDGWAIGAYIFGTHLVCPYATILALIASRRVKSPTQRAVCMAAAVLNFLVLGTVITLIFSGAAIL